MPSTAKRKEKKRFLEDKFIIPSHNKKRCFLCVKVQEEIERKRAVVASSQVVIDFFPTYFTLKESLIITAGPCMKKNQGWQLGPRFSRRLNELSPFPCGWLSGNADKLLWQHTNKGWAESSLQELLVALFPPTAWFFCFGESWLLYTVSNCNFINPLHAHCMCGTHKHLPRWYEDGRQSWDWRGHCTERVTQFLHRIHTEAFYCFKPTPVTSRMEQRLSTFIWVENPLALTGNKFYHTGND